jgi:predicted ribosomally synthesized peptide with SipW-like signal peptide
MKNLVLTLMVLLISIGVAAPMIGGTFASFSDIEVSQNNHINTACLDLKVAKCLCQVDCEKCEECGTFNDDPYVEPCFEIHTDEGKTYYPSCEPSYSCQFDEGRTYYPGCEPSYSCQLKLWNAARCEGDQCEHGVAYLHIKNVKGSLSNDLEMRVERWDCRDKCWGYGDDCWVIVKDWATIGELGCQQIELFELYASQTGKVRIEIKLPPCYEGDSVEWDMAFELLGGGFSDIETSHNYLKLGSEREGCSHGFWKKHEEAWAPTGYCPSDDFDVTFKCDDFESDITLMNALSLGGDGLNALAREAVAALLNAADPDVNYQLTPEQVIKKVQQAIDGRGCEGTKDELEGYNNDAGGCPLCN